MLITLTLETPRGESLQDITPQLRDALADSGVQNGICALIVPHTTAAITVNSALDAHTLTDIISELKRIVPTRVDFAHQYDTPADAAGHIKAALVGHSVLLAVHEGKLLLGGSQSVLFYEFDGPRTRHVQVKLMTG